MVDGRTKETDMQAIGVLQERARWRCYLNDARVRRVAYPENAALGVGANKKWALWMPDRKSL